MSASQIRVLAVVVALCGAALVGVVEYQQAGAILRLLGCLLIGAGATVYVFADNWSR